MHYHHSRSEHPYPAPVPFFPSQHHFFLPHFILNFQNYKPFHPPIPPPLYHHSSYPPTVSFLAFGSGSLSFSSFLPAPPSSLPSAPHLSSPICTNFHLTITFLNTSYHSDHPLLFLPSFPPTSVPQRITSFIHCPLQPSKIIITTPFTYVTSSSIITIPIIIIIIILLY